MNIYIYGNQSFKKDIHLTLDHANIKFKLDSNSIIKDIDSLSELKDTINQNPNDIYLIDDEKIIKKNALNQKIKFLTPKDGIEQEFLLDNNIADLSVDSLAEIPKYILKKYEQEKSFDSNIQDSIINIVDEAYENDDKVDDLELDSELANLLAKDQVVEFNLEDMAIDENFDTLSQDVNLDKIEELVSDSDVSDDEITNEEFNSLMNFDEDFGLNNTSLDYDDKDTSEEKISEMEEEIEPSNLDKELEDLNLDEFDFDRDINKDLEEFDFDEDMNIEDDINDLFDNIDTKVEESQKGESMSDEFSELDSLSEDDILKALDGFETQSLAKVSTPAPKVEQENEKLNVSSSNVDDIAQLISRLLNNKTLEITIKIKD